MRKKCAASSPAAAKKCSFTPDGTKEVIGSLGSAADLENEIHKGDWNDYVIIAKGNHLQQFINGKEMMDVVDEQSDVAAKSGVIALQLHAGQPGKCEMTVQFKNLRIKTEPSGQEDCLCRRHAQPRSRRA